MEEIPATCLYRFGLFEADRRSGRLLRHGARVKIQDQPFRVLLILLERAGEIVSREELQQKLWPSDTYVEFDGSLNAALKKLRYALGDSPDNPTFIETLPKRGYRFLAPVESVYPTRASGQTPAPLHFGRENAGGQSGSLATVPQLGPAEPVLLPFPVRKQSAPRSRVRTLAIAISALALLCAGVYWVRPEPPPRVLRSVQLTHFGRADNTSLYVTDGARIYFAEAKAGRYTIDEVPVTGGEPTPFPLPFPNAEISDISPDHTELLLGSFTGFEPARLLWVAPVTGGVPRRLGDVRGGGGTWSPDGRTIAYVHGTDLCTVDRDGNTSRKLASVPGATGLVRIQWSPSGRTLRFTALHAQAPESVWEVSADGSHLHQLLELGTGSGYGSWTPDGRYYVYRVFRDGVFSIRARRESESIFRRFSRQPVTLYTGPQFFYTPLLSTDGKKIFFIGEQERGELVRYDAASRQFVPYLAGIDAHYVTFSPDGRQALYTRWPDVEMWSSNVDGSDRRPLSFLPMRASGGRFSPDGREIAFGASTSVPGEGGLYLLTADGNGKPEQVLGEKSGGLVGWSADGASLFLWQVSESGPAEMGIYAFDLKTRHLFPVPGAKGLHHGSPSPDGRYIAAINTDSTALVLFDLHTHQQTVLAHGAALVTPYWSRDSSAVFFQDAQHGPDQPIYRMRIADRQAERVTNLAQPLATDVTGYQLTGVTPDGQVLATLIRSNSDLYALDVDFP